VAGCLDRAYRNGIVGYIRYVTDELFIIEDEGTLFYSTTIGQGYRRNYVRSATRAG
jgi:hypothetical protein